MHILEIRRSDNHGVHDQFDDIPRRLLATVFKHEGAEGVDVPAAKNGAKFAAHFPVGGVMGIGERRRILLLASKIEDSIAQRCASCAEDVRQVTGEAGEDRLFDEGLGVSPGAGRLVGGVAGEGPLVGVDDPDGASACGEVLVDFALQVGFGGVVDFDGEIRGHVWETWFVANARYPFIGEKGYINPPQGVTSLA